jgi:hypothetical protein
VKRYLTLFLLAVFSVAVFGQGGHPADVPAYHSAPPSPADKLPPLLPPETLAGLGMESLQVHAYQLAPRVSRVLYQQPCYCHCDRTAGHTSLRSCYESMHAAHCGVCLQELYYTYLQSRKGRTDAQIRQGIERGDWRSVDLNTAANIR